MPYHTTVKVKMPVHGEGRTIPKKKYIKKPARKGMTQKQKDRLKEHAKHHTTKHMAMMRKDMKAGLSFTRAHNKAKKMVGK